ncbi:hypothetical protein G7Y79_00057g090930 [Physcia stellaris]|nr:hypothetical protein G7Y79_00057g090930 [Physcia stellaris]
MWSILVCAIVSVGELLHRALALHIQPRNPTLSTVHSLIQSYNTSNSALTLPPVNSLNTQVGIPFGCSGTQYGWLLDISSCLDALAQLDRTSTEEQSWGPRRLQYDIGFPRTYWSTDLSCVVIPILAPGETHARASLQDVAAGASVLLRECVNKPPNPGGLAKDISSDQSLGVIVAKYHPRTVHCFGRPGIGDIESSCQDLLNTMDASREMRMFAAESSPRSPVVRLPKTIPSKDRRCFLTLQTTGKSDLENWERIWEDASLATAKCIRQGQAGEVAGLGYDNRLVVTVSGRELGNAELVATA